MSGEIAIEAPNVALNRPATQSSTCSWSTDPEPAADARVANNGDTEAPTFFHTGTESEPWWQVDLEEPHLIERVTIFNRLDMPDRLRDFTLLGSLDGANWLRMFRRWGGSAALSYVADIAEPCLARYVRVRLDGHDCLHFRECQVFGRRPTPALLPGLMDEHTRALRLRGAAPLGRRGRFGEVGGFDVFMDHENYSSEILKQLRSGFYENRERALVRQFVSANDRVLEAGTAIGLVAMTAAAIVGAAGVVTFDANPDIVADAKRNFERNELYGIAAHCGVLVNRRAFRPGATVDFFVHEAFWASRLAAAAETRGFIRTVTVPTHCLEDEIARHRANVLICDIEGGEVDLLMGADLTGIRLIILEIHYWAVGEQETDEMVRGLISQGFSIHLAASGNGVLALRR